MKTVLAFDFGASTGRAIKASYDGEKITYEEIHRFDNIPIEKDGHIHHDVDMILGEIDKAIDKAGHADALAFDTWGVDYGLLNRDGKLICPPFHYRDGRTRDVFPQAVEKISASGLYAKTGNQIMAINTLFQLLSDEKCGSADKILFMPDLFGYLLTGNKVCEYTIASTSQMLNPVDKTWSEEVTDTFSINRALFAPLVKSGTVLGEYRGIKVITVAGHDTQCAVAAMPCLDDKAAFLSCGTWSLIGCENDEPILNEQSSMLELSNELGANGKINYLKNISGLWLIQEFRRNLAERGNKYSYNELERMARASKPFKCFVDPDDEMLSSPGNLDEKMAAYCKKTAQPVPETTGEFVRCIYESLAMKYRYALHQISMCTGRSFDRLHLLGGGTKDGFLCQMSADCLDIPVLAGPIEATALGNIMIQLVALGELSSIQQGRELILKSEKVNRYTPAHSSEWDSEYKRFVKIIENK